MPTNQYNFIKKYEEEAIRRNPDKEEEIKKAFEELKESAKSLKDDINLMCNKRIWELSKEVTSLNGYYDIGFITSSFRETFALISEMLNLFNNGSVAPSYISEKFHKLKRLLKHYDLLIEYD